jgi:hypothetical protein
MFEGLLAGRCESSKPERTMKSIDVDVRLDDGKRRVSSIYDE